MGSMSGVIPARAQEAAGQTQIVTGQEAQAGGSADAVNVISPISPEAAPAAGTPETAIPAAGAPGEGNQQAVTPDAGGQSVPDGSSVPVQGVTPEQIAAMQAAAASFETTPPQITAASQGQLIAAGLAEPVFQTNLRGKTLSIVGDSISTYSGYIPEGYAYYYPSIENDVQDVTDTWWMQVLHNTGMRLGTNASYSASAVCGDASSTESASAGSSSRRAADLIARDGTIPDVILVYIGANDFFRSFELGRYDGVAVQRESHYILEFTEAYELMIQKLRRTYPAAQIYCCTLTEANSGDHPRVNERGNTIQDFNARIKQIAAANGFPVIDLHACGLEVYELNQYTSDGTHPNKAGAKKMADYITNALIAYNG